MFMITFFLSDYEQNLIWLPAGKQGFGDVSEVGEYRSSQDLRNSNWYLFFSVSLAQGIIRKENTFR